MAEPKLNYTHSISILFTKRHVGGIYSLLLSFFWSYSQHFWIKDRNKKGQVFMLCNLQMLFLPFQKTEEKKEAHSDLCGCWQFFELNWGCF